MQNAQKSEQYVLEHYYESWWKVKDQPIWYLGGKSHDVFGEPLTPGKWYFTDEGDQFSAPFQTYAECAKALDNYADYLNLYCLSLQFLIPSQSSALQHSFPVRGSPYAVNPQVAKKLRGAYAPSAT